MDTTLYLAMNGAASTLQQQAIYSNNLANSNSTGFRADLYYAEVFATTNEATDGQSYVVSAAPNTDFTPGSVMTTGRDLDVAIPDKGWLSVQMPNGKEAYTRNGALKINANGVLTTTEGFPVIGNGGPISIPAAKKVQIAKDGTISVIPIGQGTTSLAVVDRLKLVNPQDNELSKGSDGMIYMKDNQTAQADASVRIVQGALESSNVNAVANMVDMISASRKFETQLKLMQTIDQDTSNLARLLQIK